MEALLYKSVGQVADETLDYISKRKNHKIVSLKTHWRKFNYATGGIEPNMIFTIAGISGSGKSALANRLIFDLIECNPTQKIVVLNFSLEMVDYRNVGRAIGTKLKKTVSELYSSFNTLSDEDFNKAKSAAEAIKNYPIYFIDKACTVEEIGTTIDYFHETIAKDKWLIVVLDHTLLVRGDSERGTIVDLQKMFIEKKKLSNTTIIQISQMNRNIESPDRINNPSSHYPMRSDLAASDAIFHASDFVIAMHRPEILNLAIYGAQRLPVKNKIYLHFLKVRDGDPCILEFENELKYGEIVEVVKDAQQSSR